MRDILAELYRKLLQALGIPGLYGVTLGFFVILISYWKDIKRWDELADWHQVLIVTTAVGAIMLSVLSVLRLLGLIDL